MATNAIAKLVLDLSLDDANWIIEEGYIVKGLTYQVNSIETSTIAAGKVRVIQANMKSNISAEGTCPPEPHLDKYITITNIILDISEINHADFIKVPIKNIIHIDDVKTPDEINMNEEHVNNIFDNTPGIVKDDNHAYSYITSDGTIDMNLFDNIIALKDFNSILVTNGITSYSYASGEDYELFKQNITGLLPKSNDDPSTVLTINITFI